MAIRKIADLVSREKQRRLMMTLIYTEEEFEILSHKILEISNQGIPRIDFLQEISRLLLEHTQCDSLELLLSEGTNFIHTWMSLDTTFSFRYELIPVESYKTDKPTPNRVNGFTTNRIHEMLFQGETESLQQYLTRNGSFISEVSGNTGDKIADLPEKDQLSAKDKPFIIMPLKFGNEVIGTLEFTCRKSNPILTKSITQLENVSQDIGIALINHKTQTALHERIKELGCLYHIMQIVGSEDATIEEILTRSAKVLKTAWQYPEIASAKIVYDEQSYLSDNYKPGSQKQTSEIQVQGKSRGYIEVSYNEMRPKLDDGPFLREERRLLDSIACQLAIIIEQKEVQKERLDLQNQLRHADRLAIIGQLAAGVAHELNEPLGSILGFAQLLKKIPDFPEEGDKDLDKIIKASLHAREVIKKLLFFAKEISLSTGMVSLNKIVDEGLYFLESRCQKCGIEVVKYLQPGLPEIEADESQLHQVLVNLVVNSIQAMPEGGRILLETSGNRDYVSLVVDDNGTGMSEEVKARIFVPFFTTKDVNDGTGLGLAVVHGIVTSHKGKIRVDSELGKGTRFEIRLPVIKNET